MSVKTLTENQIAARALILLIATAILILSWLFYIQPAITPIVEKIIKHKIYELPEPLAFIYFFVSGIVPPFLIGFGSYHYAYHKWFIPNRTRLANQQLKKLSEAKQSLTIAVQYIDSFEKELKEKSSEAERLREEVSSLKLINSENAEELEKKLTAMESLTRNRIWFERAFAFFIGIFSSIVATYLLQLLQSQ